MTTEWKIERILEDLELHVRARNINTHVIEYEVRDMAVYQKGGKTITQFVKDDGEMTDDLNQAEMLVKGSIKWDGCSHNTFGEEDGYLHACSRQEMVRFGKLFDVLFDIAQELMPGVAGYLG